METGMMLVIWISGFGLISSGLLLWFRLVHRKKANIITGEIVASVHQAFSETAAAKVKILEGVNRGNHFTSNKTRAFFGHPIGKKVKVYEFEDGDDYDYQVAHTYIQTPIAFMMISILGILIALIGLFY